MSRQQLPFLTLCLATPLVACASASPCNAADGGCAEVAGTYTFTLESPITCGAWEPLDPQSGTLLVTQDGGSLTVLLFPDVEPHSLTGTLDLGSSFTVEETEVIGAPRAVLNGQFDVHDDDTLEATLDLVASLDAGQGCEGSTILRATPE